MAAPPARRPRAAAHPLTLSVGVCVRSPPALVAGDVCVENMKAAVS
jgi:hypothetical protein